MTDNTTLDAAILHELLRYEPETGKLFWLLRDRRLFKTDRDWKVWNTKNANKEAFTASCQRGYKTGSIFKRLYGAHRVCWALQNGVWPTFEIDHINHNPSDNRLINLREATAGQNKANSVSRQNSSSRYLGISWRKDEQKWAVKIRKNGHVTNLGRFFCEIEAAKAYDAAALEIHGEFANLNFPEREAA